MKHNLLISLIFRNLLFSCMLIICCCSSNSEADNNKLKGNWKLEKWIHSSLPNGETSFSQEGIDVFIRYNFLGSGDLISQTEDLPPTFHKYMLKDSILEIGIEKYVVRRLDEKLLVIVKIDQMEVVEEKKIFSRLENNTIF